MLDLYAAAGLPRNLRDLTGSVVSADQIAAVARASLPVRHMLNFPRPLDLGQVIAAMDAVEMTATSSVA